MPVPVIAAPKLVAIPFATWASIWPPASTNAAWHSVTSAVTAVHEMYALPASAPLMVWTSNRVR